jgi:hypothetical protein
VWNYSIHRITNLQRGEVAIDILGKSLAVATLILHIARG